MRRICCFLFTSAAPVTRSPQRGETFPVSSAVQMSRTFLSAQQLTYVAQTHFFAFAVFHNAFPFSNPADALTHLILSGSRSIYSVPHLHEYILLKTRKKRKMGAGQEECCNPSVTLSFPSSQMRRPI